MSTTKIALLAGAVGMVAGGLIVGIAMNPSTSTKDGQGTIGAPVKQSNAETAELNPFSHVASIPANVDPASIRFEKLKTVDVASKTKVTTDPQHCKELQFRDPGTGCQTTTVEERVKAIEAKYSFNGLAMGSGESVPGRETFSVYFRPEEVVVDGPVEKLKLDDAAAIFQISTYRPMIEQKVVDKEHTKYCDGNYMDGAWVRTDSKCQDQVQFITKTVPSPNLTVQVDVRRPATVASR
jgi:hypothetical protein